MKCAAVSIWKLVNVIAFLTFFGISASPAFAQSAVKLNEDGKGQINVSNNGPSPFVLNGTASHLGKYACHGELEFVPGEPPGSQEGHGVAVFEAANGDLLVGVVTLELDADGTGHMAFSWRDSVEFSDETVVYTTGRFVDSRPPGAIAPIRYNLLVVIAIIAILIG